VSENNKHEDQVKAVVFERGSFEVGVVKKPTNQIIKLLTDMTVGSKGAQYLLKNIQERMSQMGMKYIFYMIHNQHTISTFTANFRTTKEDFGWVNAYYIRFFAFADTVQAAKEKQEEKDKPDGIFKSLVKRFLSKSAASFGISHGEDPELPSFYYAFFDAENFRSTDMSKRMGLNPVGEFDTFSFTRLHPKKHSSISKLETVHYHAMKERVAKFYSEFSIYDDHFMYINDSYYVWKENGEVVAGLQANKCNWEIKKMSGMNGFLMLHIIPYLPLVSKYFNPKKFDFITYDFIYVKPGHEKKLEKLMEHMMCENDVTFSLIWQDLKSPLHQIFSKLDKGFLSRFSHVPTGKIMMTTNRMTKEQLHDITKKPIFTCAMDMS
tara:strand:- start:86514 stop:87650 length:1137 start_codon:yes stop_codon:yes gene_type:complete